MKDIQRALWTLLLPFTLGNVALHARPEITADPAQEKFRSRPGFNAWLIRVFGLSLTATLVLAATGVGVDLIGWQCVDQACLSAIPGPSEFLASDWWHQGGRAMAVGLLAPIGLLAAIAMLTWRSYQYEAVVPAMTARSNADPMRNPLQHTSFWHGARQVRRLAVLHVTTGGDKGPQWTNCWRATDPIGWPVAGTHGELELIDPDELHPTDGKVDGPPIRNHSCYPESKEFQDARKDVCALLMLAGQGNGRPVDIRA